MALIKPWRSANLGDTFVRLRGHTPRLIPAPPAASTKLQIATLMEALTVDPASDPTVLPTGAGYVNINTLYNPVNDLRPDGTADWGAVMARAPAGSIITFPPGVYMCSDFNSGFQGGISVPTSIKGIIGSGFGVLGSTASGTIFTMKPMSSTKGNGARDGSGKLYVPVQDDITPCQLVLFKHVQPQYASVFKNFQVIGSEQGHIYSGFQVYGTPAAATISGVNSFGWDGNSGAPPGETSAMAINGEGAHQVTDVEIDGRRTSGGTVFGAMGATFQNSVGSAFLRLKVHHTRVAAMVGYQAFNCTFLDCVTDALYSPNDHTMLGNGSVNLERCAGFTMTNHYFGGRPNKVHVTHSTDSYSLTRGGVTYNTHTLNGSLRIVNPTFNDLWGNGFFFIQSWYPYLSDTFMGDISRAPQIVRADGTTRVGARWISDRSYQQTAGAAWAPV